jgi:hypothetical protein
MSGEYILEFDVAGGCCGSGINLSTPFYPERIDNVLSESEFNDMFTEMKQREKQKLCQSQALHGLGVPLMIAGIIIYCIDKDIVSVIIMAAGLLLNVAGDQVRRRIESDLSAFLERKNQTVLNKKGLRITIQRAAKDGDSRCWFHFKRVISDEFYEPPVLQVGTLPQVVPQTLQTEYANTQFQSTDPLSLGYAQNNIQPQPVVYTQNYVQPQPVVYTYPSPLVQPTNQSEEYVRPHHDQIAADLNLFAKPVIKPPQNYDIIPPTWSQSDQQKINNQTPISPVIDYSSPLDNQDQRLPQTNAYNYNFEVPTYGNNNQITTEISSKEYDDMLLATQAPVVVEEKPYTEQEYSNSNAFEGSNFDSAF